MASVSSFFVFQWPIHSTSFLSPNVNRYPSFCLNCGEQSLVYRLVTVPQILKGNVRVLHATANEYPWSTRKKSPSIRKEKEKDVADDSKPGGGFAKLSKAARRFYNDNFREPPQRLSKVLATSGVASRRSCEELIFGGKVTVNGLVCSVPQTRVDPAKDVIYVNGNRLSKKLPPKVYFALNKPKGYICSSGVNETKPVTSLLDEYMKIWEKRNPGFPSPRLFTVGRLDVATTGLLIVTNDGEFAHSLSHPSSSLTKEYIATVENTVTKKQLFTISEGTIVDGVHCTPDSVELIPHQPGDSKQRLRIVVHEGRNHEVRELVKNAGLEIYSLKRVRIGKYRLPPDLGIGKHVVLKPSDLKTLGWGIGKAETSN